MGVNTASAVVQQSALWRPNMPAPPADDAFSCRGGPSGTLLQLALHSGWPPPDDRAPDALDPPPPEHLSPREAWLLRGGAVLRAHDVLPHFRGACSALTWMSLLGCSFRSHQSWGADTRGVIVRRATIFRPSLVATTSDRRTPVSVPAPHDVASVVVHPDTISRSRLAAVTTETGKPSITFSSSTTCVSVGSTGGTRPARARVVGGCPHCGWRPDS
jgi:hypothetical protein